MRIRRCPKCGGERPLDEFYCQGDYDGAACGWDLTFVAPEESPPSGAYVSSTDSQDLPLPVESPGTSARVLTCPNGHPVEVGDLICTECGADIDSNAELTEVPAPREQLIASWRVVSQIGQTDGVRERFLVQKSDGSSHAVLTLYEGAHEPDPEVYASLQQLDLANIPAVLDCGRWQGRAYDVAEYVTGGHLGDLPFEADDRERLRALVAEIAAALNDFARVGLRHRDLRPEAVLVRATAPLDLVIGGFGSARLSDFDLDVVAPITSSKYMAPEVIAGAVSSASDWWSLGILILEKVTGGACFEGVNDQAFLIQALVDGVAIPEDLDSDVEHLLRGLLCRDRAKRWKWEQVSAWLAGEPVELPPVEGAEPEPKGPLIRLGEREFGSPRRYALAAAEPSQWEEALEHLARGRLITWLEEQDFDGRMLATLRSVVARELEQDLKLSLAIKILNADMPLVHRGVIVAPGWLTENPEQGYSLVAGEAPEILSELGQESWLVQLRRRADQVRERAAYHAIDLVEERLRVFLVSTSHARLRALWDEQRRLFPDTDHQGLAAIVDRRQWAEEDLIILLSADTGQFSPLDEVVQKAAELAQWASVPDFAPDQARVLLMEQNRRGLFALVRERIADFASCDNPTVNEWAARFRIESRTLVSRALVILATPAERWERPPMQRYLGQLLEFFEQKAATAIRRGPLARMSVTRTGRRIDLTELGTARQNAESLLDQILTRSARLVTLDPAAFIADPAETPTGTAAFITSESGRSNRQPQLETRLRNLIRHATLYRRDTGIDGLYLGYPFLLFTLPGTSVKPRIAPILLWPIRLEAEVGRQGNFKLGFDPEREEVRINPALDGYLGPDAMERWQQATESALGRSATLRDVVDEFGRLALPRSWSLERLPGLNVQVADGPGELQCSAVLFHVAFMGQAVLEDLRQLRTLRPAGTSLEPMLRMLREPTPADVQPPTPPEHDRFFTVASDPSQEEAVMRARERPGIVVRGPPGTGKSQTIVNIIGDALGRKLSVLVVCQKQAALDVVHKRLDKECLGSRVIMVSDVNRDRLTVIRAVREQLATFNRDASGQTGWRSQREQVATRIEALEAAIDRHHQALHAVDSQCGRSYRHLISELVALEAGERAPIDAVGVRSVVRALDGEVLARIEEQCAPIASLWLSAGFENSPLKPLNSFAWDPATLQAFRRDFDRFSLAEHQRANDWTAHPSPFVIDDLSHARRWLHDHAGRLTSLAPEERADLARWFDLFESRGGGEPPALVHRMELERIHKELRRLSYDTLDPESLRAVQEMSVGALRDGISLAKAATRPAGFLGVLKPMRFLKRRRLRALLAMLGLYGGEAGMAEFLSAATHDLRSRKLREHLRHIEHALESVPPQGADGGVRELQQIARDRIARLDKVAPLARDLSDCPSAAKKAVASAAQEGTPGAIPRVLGQIEATIFRDDARQASRAALEPLRDWFEPDWIVATEDLVLRHDPDPDLLAAIERELPRLESFQRFRTRTRDFLPASLELFRALRQVSTELSALPSDILPSEVRRILRREARLVWKERIEAAIPELLAEATEIACKIADLEKLDREMRDLNRDRLINDVDARRLGARGRWEDITRLRGPRARRLREFIELGSDIGLMELRPIWMMNPNVASQVLPLKASLFDLVIFDEASQMPVEYALPSLYRGGVVVVSGDEKQLPPTAFFSSKVESDEAETFDGDPPDPDASEEEFEQIEENWNRREIKDCPDLLALAGTALPARMLEIHYRSNYRELIAFSNAAFYGNGLHVPVQHPQKRVLTAKPLEIIRVDGRYEHQTNQDEAERVVDLVSDLWAVPTEIRPTVGVVTFNRKQADLIEDCLEARAENDEVFRTAYSRECDRREDGEDLGFFVKNLENVQGDERDVIIFSTTFGRNAQGRFRRNFGVLGQRGGERRLNVAVTRARDKVILATSMPVAEVSDLLAKPQPPSRPRDYLQAYLAYAERLGRGDLISAKRLLDRIVLPGAEHLHHRHDTASDLFRDLVGSFLSDRLGREPVSAADGSVFGLDWAIPQLDGDGFAIGIECDAPVHRLLNGARAREIWRPAVLQRAIPTIYRVSSVAWYADPAREQQRLADAIELALRPPEKDAPIVTAASSDQGMRL